MQGQHDDQQSQHENKQTVKKGDRDGKMSMERYKPAESEIRELIMVEETQMLKDYCLTLMK